MTEKQNSNRVYDLEERTFQFVEKKQKKVHIGYD